MNKTTLITLLIIVFVFIKSFIIEPSSLKATTYRIDDKSLRGVKIAFISDVHFKNGQIKKVNKIAKILEEQRPNIIILGGDIVAQNKSGRIPNIRFLVNKIGYFNRRIPIFAVLGESDWQTNADKIKKELQASGVYILENSHRGFYANGKYVNIIGLSDLKSKAPDIDLAFKYTMMPRIVVTHNPDIYFDIIDDTSIILAGHTHGGQFVLPYTPALFVDSKFGSEFASGMVKKTTNTMIISKGVGTTGIPIRLNCPPEVVIVDFD